MSPDTTRPTPAARHPHSLKHVALVPSLDLVKVSQLARGPALNFGQDSGTRGRAQLLATHRAHRLPPVQDLAGRPTRPPGGDRAGLDANGTAADKLAKGAFGRLLGVPGCHALLREQQVPLPAKLALHPVRISNHPPNQEPPPRSADPLQLGQQLLGVEEIKPGDRVYFEPGENHWHGAAPNRLMTHIAIQEADENGSPVTWGAPVTDEQYNAAPAS